MVLSDLRVDQHGPGRHEAQGSLRGARASAMRVNLTVTYELDLTPASEKSLRRMLRMMRKNVATPLELRANLLARDGTVTVQKVKVDTPGVSLKEG